MHNAGPNTVVSGAKDAFSMRLVCIFRFWLACLSLRYSLNPVIDCWNFLLKPLVNKTYVKGSRRKLTITNLKERLSMFWLRCKRSVLQKMRIVTGNQVTRKTTDTKATNFAIRSSCLKAHRNARLAFISHGNNFDMRRLILMTTINTKMLQNVMTDVKRTPNVASPSKKCNPARSAGNKSKWQKECEFSFKT